MRVLALLLAAAASCILGTPSLAAEGSSAAGPIAGTDIRSAQLPPPGLYGGLIFAYAEPRQFFDRNGNLVPALRALELTRVRAAPFLLYVPDLDVLGGSIGILGVLPMGSECGRRFAILPESCITGLGDPYVELMWSRFFGTVRPSRYAGAFPIREGLTIALGFGTVIPIGRYNVVDATTQGLTIGGNVWDFAPSAAITYTTPPILAEGTEFSAKVYWNNYLENPDTQYKSGSLVNVNFAVSERIGRVQVGMAGTYVRQVEDDTMMGGIPALPDGRRTEVLSLGGVLAYDMPEYATAMKIKILGPVVSHNAPKSWGAAFTLSRRLSAASGR